MLHLSLPTFFSSTTFIYFYLLDDSDVTDLYEDEVAPERLEIILRTSEVFHKRFLQRDNSLPASSILRASFIKSKRWKNLIIFCSNIFKSKPI